MLEEKKELSRHIYSVSELTRNIKLLLEDSLADIWVRGEISNCRRAQSGHLYFTLKDEQSVIKAVLFRSFQSKIKFEIEDGLTIILHGNMSVFEKRGDYQIIVDFMEPEGPGALQLAFEQLKEKLKKEGLFDEEHKNPVPAYPDVIGVITSETGAAIRDILHVIGRRYSGIRIIIYPTLVQGEEAAANIVQALQKANERNEADVLIVGRGGGSVEDLWSFNEEIVARAIYGSKIPVISAVGHEIDFTISDFVADLRAPTPSAAAELVVKNKAELIRQHRDLSIRLTTSIERIISLKEEILSRYTIEVLCRKMNTRIHDKQMLLDELSKMLTAHMDGALSRLKARFEKTVGELNVLSPLGTLSRGYSIVSRMADDKPIFSVTDVDKGEDIKSRLRDGSIFSTVHHIEKNL